MKMFLVFTTVLFSTLSFFTQAVYADDGAVENGPNILNGRLASLSNLQIVQIAQNSDSAHPTAHSQLMATVVYSSICQTPASFVVIKNGDAENYSVIEAHAIPPRDRLTCQARNHDEMQVQVAEFYGALPKVETIRVNGIQVGSN